MSVFLSLRLYSRSRRRLTQASKGPVTTSSTTALTLKNSLGNSSRVISAEDASIRNFGFLISNRAYIYTLDYDYLPAAEPAAMQDLSQNSKQESGIVVNALEGHLQSETRIAFYSSLF